MRELAAGFGGGAGFTIGAPGFGGVAGVGGFCPTTGGGSGTTGALALGIGNALVPIAGVLSGIAGGFDAAAAALLLVEGLAACGASSEAPMMTRTAVPTTTQTPTRTRHKRSATLGLLPTSGNDVRDGAERGGRAVDGEKT